MANADGGESMARFDHRRRLSSLPFSPPSKPRGGARILSFVLQVLVMAVALSLFFLFAGVAALVLIHLYVAGHTLRRRRRLLAVVHPPSLISDAAGETSLSLEELRRLPCFEFDGFRPTVAEVAPDCAVCLEGFRGGDMCRSLPGCGHAFHSRCVDRWLVKTPSCPICRYVVVTPPVWL